ncbi:uncharacterized protein [Diadema setosum]|uniref:uncharacterized protein n=1 Tax=Diadema setosum TaxID=31175 RepID=UPI003B3A78A1
MIEVAKLVHKAHLNYVNNIIGGSLSTNPKSFWSYIRCCRSEYAGIPSIRTATKLCATAEDKAESLKDFFQSTFTHENLHQVPQKGPSPYPSIGHLHIHRTGVAKQLLQLDPSKASGPDQIPPQLLKIIAHEIAPALSFVFQQSYNCGIVPPKWKEALVTPVYKSGNRSNPQDLQLLSAWSQNWPMNFNVKKCGILSITRKRTPSIYQYILSNQVIPRVNEYKYLGVTVTAAFGGTSTARPTGTRQAKPWDSSAEPCLHVLKM